MLISRYEILHYERAPILARFRGVMSMSAARRGGFTLLETLVAVVLFGLVLTGVMSLLTQSLKLTSLFKHSLTAALLAQEGIEFVRNQRDTNVLQGDPWLQGIINPAGGPPCGGFIGANPRQCRAELNSTNGTVDFSNCGGTPCPFLRFSETTKVYNYDAASTQSIFRRSIHVDDLTSGSTEEARITVIVEWATKFGTRKVTLSDVLAEWQDF